MDKFDNDLEKLMRELRNEMPRAEDLARWKRVVPKTRNTPIAYLSWIKLTGAVAAGFLLGWIVFSGHAGMSVFESASNDEQSSQISVNYIRNN